MDRTIRQPLRRGVYSVLWAAALAYGGMVGTADAQSTVQAQVITPVNRAITRQVKLPGTLIAEEQVDLYAKVSGYVSEVRVDIGDRVSAGQALLTIDVPEMTEEIRQAEAVVASKEATVRAYEAKVLQAMREVETARAEVQRFAAQRTLDAMNLKRFEKLHAGHAAPQQALDEATSALAVTKAQYHMAESQVAGALALQAAMEADTDVARAEALVASADHARMLTLAKYATVVAPFDGVITLRNVDPGAFVRSSADGASMPVLQIMNTSRLRAVVEVAEVDAPLVHAGTKVNMEIRSMTRPVSAASVSRTAGAIRPDTRTMRVEVDIDNTDGRLSPGMYVGVTLTLESKASATLIPSKAIRTIASETVVFVIDQGVAKSVPITIGYDDGLWAEIVSGLTGSDQVITETSGAIIPGSHVRAVSAGS